MAPDAVSAAISLSFMPQVLREDLPGVLAEMRRTAPGFDSNRIARDRPARIGNGATDLRMLDRAPVVALLVMRDVVILFGGMHETPRDAVRLRAMEAFFAVAGGDQARDGVAYDIARTVLGHAERLVLVLRIVQLAGYAFLVHPLDQLLPYPRTEVLHDGDHVLAVGGG